MRKIADFVVEKRRFILTIFIIFSVIAVILRSHVNINYDIAKYLPSTSETRIGMDIMESEFEETESSFNLMFKGLKEVEKDKIYNELKGINGVSSIDYDKTSDYNKNNATLYIVNVGDSKDSKLATDVFNEITEKYNEYDIYTSGDISQRNAPVLKFWIIVLAVLCALVILIIMCESYIEPFLFLTAILMGVLLNSGTNIIFSNVSYITNSICAILQMALSMDYSIMLMNRYRQEREHEENKSTAMKNTLRNAFLSISSSSVTTIVGLLVLVFMSFRIGRDLGFVLAKGVLFSLICILLVLSALILMFDKLISKTKKKCPNIRLNKLGKLIYRFRYIAIPFFIIILLFSYFEKGNLGILYTSKQDDEISKVFAENNQIAIIYKNKDEEKVSKHLKQLESMKKIDLVLGYSNTINEKLKYNELNLKLNDLSSDVSVDDYLLKIIYYNYYNKDENNKMSFNEFVSFIKNDVYSNQNISEKIDNETKSNIDRLENFTNGVKVNSKRNLNDISNILGIDDKKIYDILTYYNSKHNNLVLGMNDFISFMKSDVLTNNTYSSGISSSSKSSLNMLSNFSTKDKFNAKMSSNELANLFGIDEEKMEQLYTYYINVGDISTKLTLQEFSSFVLNNVITNDQYSSLFDEVTINSIKTLNTFSNKNIIEKDMNSTQLSSMFGISEDIIKQLMLLKYSNQDNGTKLSILEFINYVTYIKNNTSYLDNIDLSSIDNLKLYVDTLDEKSKNTKLTATELSTLVGIDSTQLYSLYALIDLVQGNTNNWVMSPNELVSLILNNESIKNTIDASTLGQLTLLSTIMDSTLNNISYTYSELSNFIGLDVISSRNIYTLYIMSNTGVKISSYDFVNFVLNHSSDSALSGNFDKNTLDKLKLLQLVMNDVNNNKKYNSSELSKLLGIDKSSLDLIYGLYISKSNNTTISLKELVSFLVTDMMKNESFKDNFDQDSRTKINTINQIINSSSNNVLYTKDELYDIASKLSDGLDKNKVDLVYMYYGSVKSYNDAWTITVEEFVNHLNNKILSDSRFNDFISTDMRNDIVSARDTIKDAKKLLIGDKYSRIVINTKLDSESEETFEFIQNLKDTFGSDVYIIGDSPMAYEMSKTFNSELDFITLLTIIAIFIVVAFTFKSLIIPIILVVIIQCAVFMTMGILSLAGDSVYFIAILIVQSILMGATIDYAILYTSYYIEHRRTMNVKDSIINSYNQSINTILTSASILIIVTLIVGHFASAIAAKICKTISQGTMCALVLVLVLLPPILAGFDKLIVKNKIDKVKKKTR